MIMRIFLLSELEKVRSKKICQLKKDRENKAIKIKKGLFLK